MGKEQNQPLVKPHLMAMPVRSLSLWERDGVRGSRCANGAAEYCRTFFACFLLRPWRAADGQCRCEIKKINYTKTTKLTQFGNNKEMKWRY